MLRQVLTPGELADLGLDVAAHSLPQADQRLKFRAYVTCRRFLLLSCIALWTLAVANGLSCFYEQNVLLTLGVTMAVLGVLFIAEIALGVQLLRDVPCSSWDFLGHLLGFGNRLVVLCDLVLPVLAWKHGFRLTSTVMSVTCGITYVGLVGLQQLRMIFSLYHPTDTYTVQKLDELFLSCKADGGRSHVFVLFALFWSALQVRRTGAGDQQETLSSIEMFDNAVTATKKEVLQRQLVKLEESPDSMRTESRIDDMTAKGVASKVQPADTGGHETAVSALETPCHGPEDVSSTSVTTAAASSADPRLQPPPLGDLSIYSGSYILTITVLRLLTALRVYGHCISATAWRFVSGGSSGGSGSSSRAAQRPSALLRQQPLNLLLPLRTPPPSFSSAASSTREVPSRSSLSAATSVIEVWIRNYNEQADGVIVHDAKIIQLTNTSFLMDCLFLQNGLRRAFLPPDCLEAHEFSVAFTTLGRCFIADIILSLLKCFLLLSWTTSSAFLIFSLSISIFQASFMCFYNTIDGELWQDILTLE